MGNTPEIITLQFGNYSNYCGTHWWNIQEAQFVYDSASEPSNINHDILFREGKTATGQVTFTPRLLLVDLKGSVNTFKPEGDLYDYQTTSLETVKSEVNWQHDKIEVVEQPTVVKNDFQMDLDASENDLENKEHNFADTVKEWGDYKYSRYHPRSVNIINDFTHSADETSFDTFSSGTELWHTSEFQDDFSDKIRNYIEECDFCQGFQILFDIDNGFSGLSNKCIEHLQDEFGKPLLCVPIFAPKLQNFKNSDGPLRDSIRLMNIALSYSHLAEVSSLFMPLSTMKTCWRKVYNSRSLPYIDYRSDNFYQTSAIIATFLDTITLRYRLKNPSTTSYLSGFCSDMNSYSRKMVAAGIGLPFQQKEDTDLIDTLDQLESSIFQTLTPNCKVGSNRVKQSICIRGIPENRLKKPLEKAKEQLKMAAYKCSSVSEMIQLYYQCNYYQSMAHVTSLEDGLRIKKPYPHEIFTNKLNQNGFLGIHDRLQNDMVLSVPVFATVQSSSELSNTLESLHRDVKRVKFTKIHRFKESGMEVDEYEEALEQLLNFKENYDDGFQM